MLFRKKSDLVFPEDIVIGNTKFLIEVIFSKKKNSSVSVKENILTFRLSSYLSARQSENHFHELLKKIATKLEKRNLHVNPPVQFKEVLEKGYFIFANETFYLEYTKKKGVKLNYNLDGSYTIMINAHTKKDVIEKNIVKLLILHYKERLEDYLHELNKQTYNYPIKDFDLKLVNSKWGHCSYDNKIMLNLKLLNADIEVLNYVIFHEISHIRHKNHSKDFWNEVSRFCPNYKLLRKKLKENSPALFRLK